MSKKRSCKLEKLNCHKVMPLAQIRSLTFVRDFLFAEEAGVEPTPLIERTVFKTVSGTQ